jgi:predicted permease
MNDLTFAIRQLLRNPGFTAVALLTLALCLGANLVIFAVFDATLLRPLPFPDSERLVTMFNTYPKLEVGRAGSSIPDLYYRRGGIEAFVSVAAYQSDAVIVGEPGAGQRMEILRVSSDLFQTLGVLPAIGRAFSEDEMTFQTHHVAILSEDYWRRHFEADPNALGLTIRVNGFDKTIIGVLPPNFRFLSTRPQLLLPLSSERDQRGIDNLHSKNDWEMIGRLKPGATLAEAQSQIDAQNAKIAPDFPYANDVAAVGFRTLVAPLHADHVAGIRPTLLLLQAGGLLLLLIGAVNLVNLLLVRAGARGKELAVRQSLGANRLHVLRQVTTETVLLTLIGGLAGWGVGAAGVRLLQVFGVSQLPLGLHVALDSRVALTALFGAFVLGLVVGIPVAWFNLRSRLVTALQSETRGGTTSHAAQRLRHSFVAAQIALAFILLTGAGLLSVSLKRAMEISPGFRPDHVLAGHISMLHKNYFDRQPRLQFAERVVEGIGRQPGVQAVGLVTSVPVAGKAGGRNKRVMTIAKRATPTSSLPQAPFIYSTAGDYFDAMGIPLRAGRLFDGAESRRDERVCIVDEDFARRNWPDSDAVGQLVYDGPEVEPGETPFTVVGVVGAVKQTELTAQSEEGAIYFPLRDHPLSADNFYLVVRTRQLPEAIGPTLEKVVRDIEPELPLNDLRTMETRIADTLIARRTPALLAGVFAGVALLLAAVGTYGVLSFAAAQRRREIGVRMALGALPGEIGRQFLALGLRLLVVGTLLGVFGAWLTGRAMQSILFNVPPLHLATLAGTAFIMGFVALIACLLPALRASRLDPMETLREE